MQFILLATLSLVSWASASYEVVGVVDYHEKVAIPMAAKIKAAEDAILAKQNTNSRIVGGVISRPNAHPFLAGLLINYPNILRIGVCASVLVSPTRLITAAHCWVDANTQASRFVVVLGSHFLFTGGDRISTSTVVTYPGWNPAVSPTNNLAVIYLPTSARLTVNIQPIAMATNASETFAGHWAVAVGYGKTSDNQSAVPKLSVVNEVNLIVITVDQCRRVFPTFAQPNTICTEGTGSVGVCNGDGGAPLFITRNGRRELIGINSWLAAVGCELGLPSGFSRVTSFREFIAQHV